MSNYWSGVMVHAWPVWPVKSRQMTIKVAQKWFQQKNYRFWHLYKKIVEECGRFGQINCCQKLWKLSNLVTLFMPKLSCLCQRLSCFISSNGSVFNYFYPNFRFTFEELYEVDFSWSNEPTLSHMLIKKILRSCLKRSSC